MTDGLTLGERCPVQPDRAEAKGNRSDAFGKPLSNTNRKETKMFKFLATASVALALASAVQAQDGPPITPGTVGLTADGTWDCNDPSGGYLGAIVVADLSYAFINPDGRPGAYGKLNKDGWMDAPAFFILTGELKDRFGAVGLSLRGPEDRPEEMSDWSKLRMFIVITPETNFYCARRKGPAT